MDKNEKINIIIADYFTKKFGIPSRSNLAKIFFIEFNDEQKLKIENKKSFSQISQNYLDLGIGTKDNLVNKIKELYDYNKGKTLDYSELLNSNLVDTVLSFNYDPFFENEYNEKLEIVDINEAYRELIHSNKMKYYNVFGNLNDTSKMIITSQDMRRFKLLPQFKEFFNNIRRELILKKTIILGDDLEDPDFFNFLDFIFEKLNLSQVKPIYYLNSKNTISENVKLFLENYKIEKIPLEARDEFLKVLRKEAALKEEVFLSDDELIEQLGLFSTELTSENTISKETKEVTQLTIEGVSKKKLESKEASDKNNFGDTSISDVASNENSCEDISISDIISNENIIHSEEPASLGLNDNLLTFETAVEMRYKSLKIQGNPIFFTNMALPNSTTSTLKLKATEFFIGKEKIHLTKIYLSGNNQYKFLEFKTREFRLKFSVNISRTGEIFENNKYLEYEINSDLPTGRTKIILELFSKIFSGYQIKFISDNLSADINLENQNQQIKFSIMKKAQEDYFNILNRRSEIKGKKFSSSSLTYYQMYLLSLVNKEPITITWGNLTFKTTLGLEHLLNKEFSKIHFLNYRGTLGHLEEKIKIIEPISEKKIIVEDGEVKIRHCRIELSVIELI